MTEHCAAALDEHRDHRERAAIVVELADVIVEAREETIDVDPAAFEQCDEEPSAIDGKVSRDVVNIELVREKLGREACQHIVATSLGTAESRVG